MLSGVVVRAADDNAVEGPRVRLHHQRRFREFLYHAHHENPEAFYSTVTDFARFLG
jgi:hypothetical protein